MATELASLSEIALLMAYDEMGQECEQGGNIDRAFFWYTLGMKTHPAFYECRFVRFNFRDRKELEAKLHRRRPFPVHGTEWSRDTTPAETVVYVYAEEGFGDTIQFCRYLDNLMRDGYHVVLGPQPELASLMLSSWGDRLTVVTELDEAEIPFSSYVPLLSLPHSYSTRVNDIPLPEGYLSPDPERVARYHDVYFGTDAYKVGIVWQGAPDRFNDKQRSLCLAELLPLAEIEGVQLFALQAGFGGEQLQSVPSGVEIIDVGSSFNDFGDTAAAIANLDLLISIDTSVAHLGGALGCETWVVLPHLSDWRWFLKGATTPWYANVTLFRQEHPNEWTATIARLKQRLAKRLEEQDVS